MHKYVYALNVVGVYTTACVVVVEEIFPTVSSSSTPWPCRTINDTDIGRSTAAYAQTRIVSIYKKCTEDGNISSSSSLSSSHYYVELRRVPLILLRIDRLS